VLALLPLAVLSFVQVRAAQRDFERSALQGVVGAGLAAAQPQVALIRDAQITVRTFAASVRDIVDDQAACAALSRSVAATMPEILFASYIPMSGQMTCSSTGAVADFSNDERFRGRIARPVPMATYNPSGPISGVPIVGLSHPVFDASGRQLGIVGVSLPYESLTPGAFSQDIGRWRPEFLATITRDGVVLSTSRPDVPLEAALPRRVAVSDLPARAGTATFETDGTGPEILSVTSVAKDLFLVSVWHETSAGFFSPWNSVAPYLLPALTWIAALAAAAFASGRLVVRHVRALALSMDVYLRQRRPMIVPAMVDAPAEIQRLYAAYEELVRTIEQEEAELQNLIVDKDNLLREVNHRSGNSLQIIASVMRMYRREARDPAVKDVLDGMINRVIALSSTHTSLYDRTGQHEVSLQDVVMNVVSRLKEIHRIPIGTTARRLEPVWTDAQTAIGVAMAAAEATSAFFRLKDLHPGQLGITLEEQGGRIRLEVNGPELTEFRSDTVSGIEALPARMLRQFAYQLGATLTLDTADGRSKMCLDLPNPAADRLAGRNGTG
jgi:two-component system, sensor histidine kinase PdtaS